ncbi:hypothetical protein H6G41_17820 [Tolypothrix sp. FACHB-123]|uniref:DUF6174 domain-containing protein n=1 Tax=Tolypothrix sp. FACHB-123 TaxID=2692868 RepID=UPI00168530D1|nr:DUF6174 domain-containing protein [Tolypothrix sp. FACHB-123]MBD2356461.1 hypothetical protein [Tolypothrix sp. FACHB-123]
MRLPILITTGLLLTLSLNTPVLSQPVNPAPQSPAIANSQLQQLTANRQLWRKQNIRNYRYKLSRSCFCVPQAREPVMVTVRKARRTWITDGAGKAVERELFQQYDTVPKLFNLIEDAIAKKASNLTVQYDSKFGYPTQINIDYDSQMADEELYLTIENLQKINR